jgi:dipeptidyl aminopeptidase/acylaminoacyl peptidase
VKRPGGDRRQLTFLPEPVAGGSFRPKTGEFIVFSQDIGGGEFYQLYRYDVADGRIVLLTDGKSRNSGPRWSNDGSRFACTSTRRTGKDTDIYLLNPAETNSNRLLIEVSGGGWSVLDWSHDDTKLLLGEYISINESYLYVADAKTGEKQLITPKTGEKVAWGEAQFARDGKSVFATTDKDSEFQRLCRVDLASGKLTPLTADISWNVDTFDLSPDGRLLAFVTNEDGVSKLQVMDARTARAVSVPKLPLGVIGGLEWHANNRDVGFSMNSARSPTDAYSLDVKTGKIDRWTESETGGLNAETFVEPELIKLKSFDGLGISAFVYLPDPKVSGPRPALINIHGGPESQARPIFRRGTTITSTNWCCHRPSQRARLGRLRKTFHSRQRIQARGLSEGYRRPDCPNPEGRSVRWPAHRGHRRQLRRIHGAGLDDALRRPAPRGVDVVGISNFLTFLKNTQDYRRDLRRAEYGDERDARMREHLDRISPTTNVRKIRKPSSSSRGRMIPRSCHRIRAGCASAAGSRQPGLVPDGKGRRPWFRKKEERRFSIP